MQAVACVVRVHSCPQFLNSPPVNSQRLFLSEERGCSQDSEEILKSRVKRAGGLNFRTHYKKENFQTTSKRLKKSRKRSEKLIKMA